MKDRLTSVIAILLLITLVGMSYWYSIRAQMEGQGHLSDIQSPDFIAHDIAITKFDKEGKAASKVLAQKVVHYSDGRATAQFPQYFSLNPKDPQVTAKSDSADMVAGGEIIHFYDNVDINQAASEKEPHSRLETSQMDVYPDTETYKSDKFVKLTRGDDVSTGIGMDYDNVERTFKLRSQVQTVVQPRKRPSNETEQSQPNISSTNLQ